MERGRDPHAAHVDLVDRRRGRKGGRLRRCRRLRVVGDELERRRPRRTHRLGLGNDFRVDDLDLDAGARTPELGELDDVRLVDRRLRLARFRDRLLAGRGRLDALAERGNRDLDHLRERRVRRFVRGGRFVVHRGHRFGDRRGGRLAPCPSRQARLDRRDRGVQRRRVDGHAALVAQPAQPVAERGLRDADHLDDRGRDRTLLVEEPVVEALDVPRELAQLLQADHPPRALERVEAAAHRAQRLAVARVVDERAVLVADRVEHLGRLGQVDL